MIDIEKFICSLLADHPEGVTVRRDIHKALKDQGLEYKDGKIVNIGPKFKIEEGKWYVCISQFGNCIEGRVYKATSYSRIMDDFGTEYNMHSDAYQYFRLWTIQDAKDGDVLYTSSTASNEVFIFKGLTIEGNIKCYCSYDSEDKYCEGKYHFIGKPTFRTCPATKEQHNLLFQKMKEAGYEWDSKKKVLKKIKQEKSIEFKRGYKKGIEDVIKWLRFQKIEEC